MSINKNDIPEVAPTFRVQWEEAQDCWVVLYPEGMVKLNPSSGEIMKRVDGKNSIADIINDLEAAFPGAELEDDVVKFMEVAYDNGWLRNKK